ncbi:unnamed protein product [[Actinomadura] parvosata subsp. kistnae]|nr:unnamed protein product [Actinomadura parvosata subsp. kistnae]
MQSWRVAHVQVLLFVIVALFLRQITFAAPCPEPAAWQRSDQVSCGRHGA